MLPHPDNYIRRSLPNGWTLSAVRRRDGWQLAAWHNCFMRGATLVLFGGLNRLMLDRLSLEVAALLSSPRQSGIFEGLLELRICGPDRPWLTYEQLIFYQLVWEVYLEQSRKRKNAGALRPA